MSTNAFQDAVNAAPAGTAVTVPAGTYGPVDISKTLTISAAGAIVDAAGAAGKSALRIHGASAKLSVSSVTLRGATAQNFAGLMIDGQAASPNVVADDVAVSDCCFGVRSYLSPGTKITNYLAEGCAVGIGLQGAGGGVVDGFMMTDLNRMVVDDTTPGNDNGGNGFQLNNLRDGQLTTIRNGLILRARAQSDDYGVDGGGIELFGASDVLIENVAVTDCVNISETGTNPGMGDCARIVFDSCTFTGRPGTDHTQDQLVVMNGIYARDLVDSKIAGCIFDRIDWFCFDFTEGSKFDGTGTRNVEIVDCVFILRDGVDRVYSFGPALPPGMKSSGNVIVAPLTATLALLNGQEFPATPQGFAAWQAQTGLEAGSQLYTPEQWAAHNAPPVVPLPTPDSLILPIQARILSAGMKLGNPTRDHDERALVNALCKAYRDAYSR